MDLMRRAGRELRAVLRAETPAHRRYRDHLSVIVVVTIGVDLDAKPRDKGPDRENY
jgi:hypothetical protein